MINSTSKDRVCVRLDTHSKMIIDQLVVALNSTYSKLLRTIIADFITTNEDRLDNIIDNVKEKK